MPGLKTITGNGLISLGDTGEWEMGVVTFQVSGIAGASLQPKRAFLGSGFTPSSAAYRNELTQSEVAIGVPITADGIYSVRAGPTEVLLDVTGFVTPIAIDYAPLYGTRRRAGADLLPAGNSALLSALGGNGDAPGFYDVRVGVESSGASFVSWSDMRGSGFGPIINVLSATPPGWDNTNKLVTFNGSTQWAYSAEVAAYDISTPKSIILVGALKATTSEDYAALHRTGLTHRLVARAIGSGVLGATVFDAGTGASVGSAVASGTTRRVLCAGFTATTIIARVPNDALASVGYVTSIASGNHKIVLGAGNHAGLVPAPCDLRAAIVLARAFTSADADAVLAWAVTHHGAVAA